MGFELVYCYNCQKRLTEDDFKEGQALRVGIHTTCLACSDGLLKQLTPEQQKTVLIQSRITVSTKKESTRVEKAPPGRPATVHGYSAPTGAPGPRPVEPAPEKQKRPVALIAGGGAGALVLIVILVMAFSGSKPEPPKPPPGSGSETGGGTPAPADPKRAQEALDALRKAHAYARANPADHPAGLRLFEEAARLAEGTPHAEAALRARDEALFRQREALKTEIADLEKQIRSFADEKTYQTALDRIAAARPRYAAPDWTRAVERMEKEILDAAAGNFVRVKARAVEAAEMRKPAEEIKSWRDEVVKWGIQKYVDDLDQALAAAGAPAGAGTPPTGGTPAPPTPAFPDTAEPGALGPFDLDGEGYVRSWLVAGAFPNPNRTGLRFDFLNGEASFTPSQGKHVTGPDGTKAKWSAYASPETKVSFLRVTHLDRSAGRDYTLAYAACWLESDRDQEVRLRVRSDDGYRLWVDDRRIAEVSAKRSLYQGEEVHAVRLAAGKHRVLIKVDNTDNDHEFLLRVLTPQDGRATGIKVWN